MPKQRTTSSAARRALLCAVGMRGNLRVLHPLLEVSEGKLDGFRQAQRSRLK
jgi:hypothetical protein